MFERVLALAGSTQFPNDEIGSPKNIFGAGRKPLSQAQLLRAVTVQHDDPTEGGCDWMRLDRDPNRGVHRIGILRPRLIARLDAQDESRSFSRDVEAQRNRRPNSTHPGTNGVKRQKFGPLE